MPPRGEDSQPIPTHLATAHAASSSSSSTSLSLSNSASSNTTLTTTNTSTTQASTGLPVNVPTVFSHHRRYRHFNRFKFSAVATPPASLATTAIETMTLSNDHDMDKDNHGNGNGNDYSSNSNSSSSSIFSRGMRKTNKNMKSRISPLQKVRLHLHLNTTPKISVEEEEEEQLSNSISNDCSQFPRLEMEHQQQQQHENNKNDVIGTTELDSSDNDYDSSLLSSSPILQPMTPEFMNDSTTSTMTASTSMKPPNHCISSSSSPPSSPSFKKNKTVIQSIESETISNNLYTHTNKALHVLNTKVPTKSSMSSSSSSSSLHSATSSLSLSSSASASSTMSTSMNTTTTTKKQRKTVHFESIQIRTFHQILGDHPCCSTGLPLTFGWDHVSETTLHVEDYETMRECCLGGYLRRRSRHDLRLDEAQRRNILSGGGSYEGSTITSSRCVNGTIDTTGQQGEHIVHKEDMSMYHDGLLSPMEMKRAERRTYRNRERMRKRAITSRFFDRPVARTE